MKWQVCFSLSSALLIGICTLSSVAGAQTKTIALCQEEWRANRAANQASGVTELAYVAKCRGTPITAQPATAPSARPAPTTTNAAPPVRPTPSPNPTARPAPANTGTPGGANEFSTEVQAKGHCPTDTIVWVNLSSRVYHYSGSRVYGNTKKGAYMCERDTVAAGNRAAKNEKRT